MKLKHILFSFIAASITVGCSDKDDEPGGGEKPISGKYQLSGKVEKGPFVRGSSISVQPLNDSMTSIGSVFNGEIQDDAGYFELGQIELASQFVRIATDGYYFNEVSGELSTGQLHLIALADLTDKSTVNVNIITHLKSSRIQNLIKNGKSFAEADKQAQKELLTQFGLQSYENTPAEAMSITSGNDGSGVLIAISSLILNKRSDAEITQFLSVLTQDLADDGSFTEDNLKEIAIDRAYLRNNLDFIVSNVKSRYSDLGQNVDLPDLRYYFDWNGDGVAGNEIDDNPQISLSRESVEFDYNGGTAEVIITSNIVLSLEMPKDPDGYLDTVPGYETINDTLFKDFYVDNNPEGSAMTITSTYENGILKISVPKSERHKKQFSRVVLYDQMGIVRVSIPVTLEANPNTSPGEKPQLSNTGQQIVSYAFVEFVTSISWMYYIERGYTGMYKFYDVQCPLSPDDIYNKTAFCAAYNAASFNNNVINALARSEYYDAIAFFTLLDIINYTEMVDKWGNIGVVDLSQNLDSPAIQQSASKTLRYLETKLDEIAPCLSEGNVLSPNYTAEEIFNIPKDVWRIAKANVYIGLNEPAHAIPYLQEIVDSHKYTLSTGNEYEANSGSILFFNVSEEVMPGHTMSYYSYADVLLLLAECNVATGNDAKASSLIKDVAKAKNISISGDNISDIDTLRRQLCLPRYFAFQKRNNLGGYASYQHLWPITNRELDVNPNWSQNPGY